MGTTTSIDFPTLHPLDLPLHTGALWKTGDGGVTWTNLTLDAFSIFALEPSRTARNTTGSLTPEPSPPHVARLSAVDPSSLESSSVPANSQSRTIGWPPAASRRR